MFGIIYASSFVIILEFVASCLVSWCPVLMTLSWYGLLRLPIHKVMETGTGQTMPQMVGIELELEIKNQRVNEDGRLKRKKKKKKRWGAEDQSEMRGTAEQAPGASLHL